MIKARILFCSALLLSFSQITYASSSALQWASVTAPNKTSNVQSIGTYTSGCVSGSAVLPTDGQGYQVMRLSRQRNYGHPNLINFIQTLAWRTASEQSSSLLIGDLAQARGGPTPSGHRSHQTGLDVDIWFLLLPSKTPPLSLQERETWNAPSMLTNSRDIDKTLWTKTHERILETAAQLPNVERIFVNAHIKRELCNNTPITQRAWLRKIRPWWKHDDHFHVRLSCPEGNKHCKHQEPLPAGDGCDSDLAWWFSADSNQSSNKITSAKIKLPTLCEQILKE